MYVIFTLTGKKHIRQRDFNTGVVPPAPGTFLSEQKCGQRVFFFDYPCVFKKSIPAVI
jgi:hypothetical protein